MKLLQQSLRRIPYWAYMLVVAAIVVNSAYLHYKSLTPDEDLILKSMHGLWIVDGLVPGSPAEHAGLKPGDTVLSVNGIPVDTWLTHYNELRAGDSLTFRILRHNGVFQTQYIMRSMISNAPGFFWTVFILMIILNITSLYILFKKPDDKAVKLFFIYLQIFSVNVNALSLPLPDLPAIIVCDVFLLSSCLLGPTLIHFHLLFPRPVRLLSRFKGFPVFFYATGILIFIPYAILQYLMATSYVKFGLLFGYMDRIGLVWMTLSFIVAMATAVYQFMTIKDSLAHNQLRMVIIGSFFGFVIPICYALFYNYINQLNNYATLIMIPQGINSMIMIGFILIAIFRYRIWHVEIFIRKALLYISATIMIIVTYFLLIWVVDRLIIRETNFTRFLIVAVSVALFLLLRDRIQRMIDRWFHRESYDSATVVSDFERKLSGVYQLDQLTQKIVEGMDEIFHFKSFIFSLKKNELTYQPVFVQGVDPQTIGQTFYLTPEFEENLIKSKVFSPRELNSNPSVPAIATGELIIPLLSDSEPKGFFVCGQKKSERIYSQQDIRVLSLLARRVIALLHTAKLYQKNLDRQMMLERERTRISQDMHDDVGASLTRISILSEMARNNPGVEAETRQWLGQISETSRSVIEEMSQIVWALNPKNDTLEGLVAYIRRFANEYLEHTSVNCSFGLPLKIPEMALSVEVRRNIYLVVREALHNVVKHSGATKVLIALSSFTSSRTVMTSPTSPSKTAMTATPIPSGAPKTSPVSPSETTMASPTSPLKTALTATPIPSGAPKTSPVSPSETAMTSPAGPLILGETEVKTAFRTGNGIRLSIRDNGSGFDSGNLEFPGNGLINMKKRMADIGGNLTIASTPGAGTEILLEV